MQWKHCTLSWDSIGSYLEWGSVPSAHNGDANWAAKYREKSSPCQICEHGKSPACQIWFRYCYTSYLFRLPMLFCSTIHASTIEWEKTRKSSWRQIWIVTSQVVSMSPNLCLKKVVSIPPYLSARSIHPQLVFGIWWCIWFWGVWGQCILVFGKASYS